MHLGNPPGAYKSWTTRSASMTGCPFSLDRRSRWGFLNLIPPVVSRLLTIWVLAQWQKWVPHPPAQIAPAISAAQSLNLACFSIDLVFFLHSAKSSQHCCRAVVEPPFQQQSKHSFNHRFFADYFGFLSQSGFWPKQAGWTLAQIRTSST